jgi:type II secretory pathway pseudopilin PulG
MVIICLLMTLATPSFRSAIEQARVDNAVANLKTIWSAQRVYWLEYHAFSPQLSSLQTMDLIDSDVAASAGNPGAIYAYTVSSASASDFTAKAIRNGSTSWMGQLEIDCGGQVTGAIAGPSSQVLTPARQ